MGLIYIPGDANQVETQLTNDLQMSEAFLNRLKEATSHLTAIVGGGKLDGKAYKKGLGLMQDCVLPTIQHTTSAIDGIKQDLSSFSRAKSGMPNEPLYEDKLNAQIAELEAQKAAQAALSAVYQSHILSLIAGPGGAAVDQAIHQFTDAKNQLSSWGNSVEEEIRKTKEKRDKLRQFNSVTNSLFHSSVSNLKIAMQGVMVLNGSKINSDGSYSLPKGKDKTWFEKERKNNKNLSKKEEHGSVDKDISDGDVGFEAYAGKGSAGDKQNGASVTGLAADGSVGVMTPFSMKNKKEKNGKSRRDVTFGLGADANIGISAAEAEAHGQLGNDQFNAHGSVSGSSYTADAKASLGLGQFTDKNDKSHFGVQAEVGAEAYIVEGEAKAGFTIFGVKFNVTGSAGVGGAISVKAGVTADKAEAKFKLGSFGLGLSIGG